AVATRGAVANDALAQGWEGNFADDRSCSCFAKALVVEEKERAIFLDRTTDRTAEDVSQQLRTLNAGGVVKEVVCSRNSVAVCFKQRTVPLIRSGARHK